MGLFFIFLVLVHLYLVHDFGPIAKYECSLCWTFSHFNAIYLTSPFPGPLIPRHTGHTLLPNHSVLECIDWFIDFPRCKTEFQDISVTWVSLNSWLAKFECLLSFSFSPDLSIVSKRGLHAFHWLQNFAQNPVSLFTGSGSKGGVQDSMFKFGWKSINPKLEVVVIFSSLY